MSDIQEAAAKLAGELLPCPFCGCDKNISMVNERHDHSGGYYIGCPACECSTSLVYACGDDPFPKLREQWNRRAISTQAHAGTAGEGAQPKAWVLLDSMGRLASDARACRPSSDPRWIPLYTHPAAPPVAEVRVERPAVRAVAVQVLGSDAWNVNVGAVLIAQYRHHTDQGTRETSARAHAAKINAELDGGVAAFGCNNEASSARHSDGGRVYMTCRQWCGSNICSMSFAAAPQPLLQPLSDDIIDGLNRAAQDSSLRTGVAPHRALARAVEHYAHQEALLRPVGVDEARLDWLESGKHFPLLCYRASGGFEGFTFHAHCRGEKYLRLRDAIDAKMLAAKHDAATPGARGEV